MCSDKGTLYSCCVHSLTDYDFEHKYLVARKLYGNGVSELKASLNTDWLLSLAPTRELFSKVQSVKESSSFTQRDFDTWYTDSYLENLSNSEEAQASLNRIRKELDSGEDVLISCWCLKDSKCHTRLLLNLFGSEGYSTCRL